MLEGVARGEREVDSGEERRGGGGEAESARVLIRCGLGGED